MIIKNMQTNWLPIVVDTHALVLPPGGEVKTTKSALIGSTTYVDSTATNYTLFVGESAVVIEPTMSGQASFDFGMSLGLTLAAVLAAVIAAKRGLSLGLGDAS